MRLKTNVLLLGITMLCSFCSSNDRPTNVEDQVVESTETIPENTPEFSEINIISLGDSYTIGASVCATCRFPEQLKDSIIETTQVKALNLKVIAKTGWTTSNLLNVIEQEDIANNYNLATLLIGVNNQYQNLNFSVFENEFPILVDKAISFAGGVKQKLLVISIPDYAFTPFGKGNTSISVEIDKYNNFIKNYCEQNNITYIYVTDITRKGLTETNLVANDGLHPSSLAYSKFVERILPEALKKLGYNIN
ncbi:GDSL-type esterase/lipase family protein [Aestuariibaculum sediminum]|uniref:SGNH/GDSL hydrolase family protein n=1 Tax=Aestuariibaculum sediminum TaxID=2770637 RepID=A0A8J6PYC6_9FLAO|nr:GDSL-type esterase/lipase family protein [Aestuariibaculum sediminum]MBD0830918.1 SGNH/GDSL hydrolase family protein [Aestuariibaculum sediminum]